MRVIVLMNSLYTGGAEFSTLSFYQWLRQQQHEVLLVCVKKASPSYDPRQFEFDQVDYLATGSFIHKVRSFNELVRSFRPDIVHSVLFDANLIGRMSRIRHRSFIHLESLVNEMYSDYRLADPRVTRFKLEGYRLLDRVTQRFGVDHFHANGKSVASHYMKKLGIDETRITIVNRGRLPNPFVDDENNRRKVREELHTGHRLMLIHAGRHEFQKGQDVLLDAIYQIRDVQDKIKVVLVGREGNYTSVINEKIKKYCLEQCVLVTGHRNDLSSLLAAADIFLFPSRFEGLPGVLIEAEAAGLPIVCSDIDNNKEVVKENVNALLFGVNDADEMAVQIEKLLRDKTLREKMGASSLSIFNERFQWEGSHGRMEELLKSVIPPPAPSRGG
jgi:glycosyltransferase involved in cell wall biosynthesis